MELPVCYATLQNSAPSSWIGQTSPGMGPMEDDSVTPKKNDELAPVSRELFTAEDWWQKLEKDKREEITAEAGALANAMMSYGFSALAIGEHLSKLRESLSPHYGAFTKLLRRFNFTRVTAYYYMNGYAYAKARLPEMVLKAAMVRGLKIMGRSDEEPLGVYTAVVKKLPPPKTESMERANEYWDQAEVARRKMKAAPEPARTYDLETVLKECIRFVDLRFQGLTPQQKGRGARKLIGMMMTKFGITNSQSLDAEAIPETFKAVRGRPRKKLA